MKLEYGYTVEEQITGHARHGGIQIDVFPLLENAVNFYAGYSGALDLNSTPATLGLGDGYPLFMKPSCVILWTSAELCGDSR
jgi:hypothetical protein